ncbi:LAME_0H20164g1_1 [Lachancea meyersii CBS 8951]|uniref:LAME_0H20164g1_1 n=1 Tax=Lachancea meyersii CBS 8951 TaxID=1266667 RepID=A0A1G4KJL8_9SACH|nr:LAME_0H20164g1_1 [Lachancea meyersii CBS 8951]
MLASIRSRGFYLPLIRRINRFSSTTVYEPPKFEELNTSTWLKMNKETKDEIIEYLDWKMEADWSGMAQHEQRAAYFVSFGDWGPRAEPSSKAAQMQMSGAEIILRGIFSGVLFAAVAVSALNYGEDRKVSKNLEMLKKNAEGNP